MSVFLDTNILIYAVFDTPDDLPKRDAARTLLSRTDCCLSMQVVHEFFVQAIRPTRKERLTPVSAMRFVNSWRRHSVQDMTMALFDDAMRLFQRDQLSFWDSTIVAAARAQGCEILYTEDMQDGQIIDGMRIVNPFV